jgi:hypothetical protein
VCRGQRIHAPEASWAVPDQLDGWRLLHGWRIVSCDVVTCPPHWRHFDVRTDCSDGTLQCCPTPTVAGWI